MKARPGYGLVLEEYGIIEGTDKSHTWHVDPLDGTSNFLHGIPHFAISVGLEREGQIVAGVIYDPVKDELFVAERGKGAYLNNRRLRVSGRHRHGRRARRLRHALSRARQPSPPAARGRRRDGGGRRHPADGLGGPRPRLRRLRPARPVLGARPADLGHRGRHHPGARGRRLRHLAPTAPPSPSPRRSVACGNEGLHRELVAILRKVQRPEPPELARVRAICSKRADHPRGRPARMEPAATSR